MASPQPKYRNLYSSNPFKPAYTNVRIDPTASQKIKCGLSTVAVPWGGTNGAIGIFGVQAEAIETKKIETTPPYLLSHNKQIADFAFSPLNDKVLASSTRSDALIRVWKIPDAISAETPAECDAPDLFLAGHEKRVDVIRFHPTVGGIVLSASMDGSIKIWDVESIQDRITLSVPNEAASHCMCFDYGGDALGVAANDGNLHIYDPRAQPEPIQSFLSTHNPAKGIKTLWLSPDPLLLTSGFSRQGLRELCLYDTRKLQAPINKLVDEKSGVGILNLFWDPAIPLVYVTSKGEGLRVYEVCNGNIASVANIKSDKQVTQVDLCPKSLCNTSKCEIARFVRLGTDNVIDISCINVPRVNSESIYQQDLYPPYASVDPEVGPHKWFDENESIEPLMVEMVTVVDTKKPEAFPTLPPLPVKTDSVFNIKPSTSNKSLHKSATIRRAPTVQTKGVERVSNSEKASSAIESIPTSLEVNFEGCVFLEKRGWFSNAWEPQYFRLRKSNIYVFESKDADNPISCIYLNHIEKIEAFTIGKDIGIAFDFQAQKYRYKFEDTQSAIKWRDVFSQVGFELVGFPSSSTSSSMVSPKAEQPCLVITPAPSQASTSNGHLAPIPKPLLKTPSNSAVAASLGLTSPNHSRSASESEEPTSVKQQSTASKLVIAQAITALIGNLDIYVETMKGKPAQWFSRLIALQNDGMLYIYSEDLKAYTQKKPPSEIMDFTKAISVRLTSITEPGDTNVTDSRTHFQIQLQKRVIHFKAKTAYEAANWVVQIQRVLEILNVSSEGIDTASHEPIEGWVKSQFQWDKSPTWYWLCVVDFTSYYFKSQLSIYPAVVKPSGDIVDLKLFGTFSQTKSSGSHTREGSSSQSYHSRSLHARAPGSNRSSTATRPTTETVSAEDALNFEVIYGDGEAITHRVRSVGERDFWLAELDKLRLESIDVLGRLGVKSEDDLKGLLGKVGNTEADMMYFGGISNSQVIDDGRLNKGEEKTLTQVMGKTLITINFVKCDWTSIRSDCAYVLDIGKLISQHHMEDLTNSVLTGSTLYHWNGEASSRIARAKALDVASRLRKERSNRPRVILVESDESALLATMAKLLNAPRSTFLVERDAIPPQTEDEVHSLTKPLRIYKVTSSKSLKRRIRLVYEGYIPSKKILENEAVFIVQCPSEVFVWTGKGCMAEHRSLAYVAAKKAVSEMAQSVKWITVQRTHYERESAVFREKFIDYEGSLPISMRLAETKGNIATNITQKPIDVKRLLIRSTLEHPDLDNGKSGKSLIFLVRDFTREAVDRRFEGQFFKGDSYIVFYTYRPTGSGVDKSVSYFWQGSESKITQKGTSALMTVELSKETGGDVMQIRVPEGKEPKHLLQLMSQNRFIIRKGTLESEKKKTETGLIAFDVRVAVATGMTKACEIEPSEISFASNAVYILTNGSIAFLWEGSLSNDAEKEYAKSVAIKMIGLYSKKQSSEIEDSLIYLSEGGKAHTEFDSLLQNIGVSIPPASTLRPLKRFEPRLFACSSGSGMVTVEEVVNFTQEDLDTNIVMLLDTYSHLYVWFGSTCKVNEKIIGMETILRALKARTRPIDDVLREYKKETYSVDVLMGDKVPENVDMKKLEMYLTEDDFEALFKMKKEEYLTLQPWKREKIKKEVGFF
ncbi:Coronin-2B [Dinochytrium kinnereticum]|nr:Coronin-2B [Dinochytrium kinnereticum]